MRHIAKAQGHIFEGLAEFKETVEVAQSITAASGDIKSLVAQALQAGSASIGSGSGKFSAGGGPGGSDAPSIGDARILTELDLASPTITVELTGDVTGVGATTLENLANGTIVIETSAGLTDVVSSFNTRTGPVTLLSSDVTDALTYIPLSNVSPIFANNITGLVATSNTSLFANNAAFLNGELGSFYMDLANSTGTLPAARLSGTYNITVLQANNTTYFNGETAAYYRNYNNLTNVPTTFAPSSHTHVINDVTGLQTALDGKQASLGFTPENVANKNAVNGYAGLDSAGKILTSTLPDLAISDTFVVASQAAMLALTAQRGDVAIRTDVNETYILSTNSPTTLGDWIKILSPAAPVLSVAGLTGTISNVALKAALALTIADTSGLQAALDAKANLTGASFTGSVSVRTSGSTGYAALYSGDGPFTGYINFFSPAGADIGYIGYGDGANALYIHASGGRNWHFTQRPVFAGATPWDSVNFNPALYATAASPSFTDRVFITDGAGAYASYTGLMLDLRRTPSNGAESSQVGIRLGNGSNTFDIRYGGTTDRLRFIAGGATEVVTFLNNGNVGIGTAAPADKLHVEGNIYLGTTTRYIYQAGAGNLSLQTGTGNLSFASGNGVDVRLTIAGSTGNVGIGTNTPVEKLDVAGNVRIASNGSFYWGDATTQITAVNGGTLRFLVGNAGEKMRIESSGNVGIGTTTPQYRLDVNRGSTGIQASFGTLLNNGEIAGIHFGYSESANALFRKSAIVFERSDAAFGDARGKVHILNGPAAGAGSATLADAKLTIDSAGNVGIGITSPADKLSIRGGTQALLIETSSDPASYRARLLANYNYGNPVSLTGLNNEEIIGQYDGYNVRIGGTSGNVGIGTAPVAGVFKLSVGTGTTDARSLFRNNAIFAVALTQGAAGGNFYLGASAGADPSLTFARNNGTQIGALSPAGNMWIEGTFTAGINRVNIGKDAPFVTGGNIWTDGYNLAVGTSTSNQLTFHTSNTTRAAITSGGSLISYVDTRAPIFYDQDNTGFYVDPASGSTLAGSVTVAGGATMSGGWNRSLLLSASFPVIVFGSAGVKYSGIGVDFSVAESGMRFWVNGSSADISGTGTVALAINTGNFVTASGSFRSPIYYDSNNTGYYVDPNSTSRMGTINADLLRSFNNVYTDQNYGYAHVGLYSSVRYQGVFAMGAGYELPADGTTTGSLYGIAWAHPYAGGIASNLSSHGALFLENGAFMAAVSGSIRCRDDMRTPIYYDSNNTGYYADLNSTSNMYAVLAYQYQGNGNVGGTGSASYHPSGIYSTGTNWLYGTMYLNGNAIYDCSRIDTDILYDRGNTAYYCDPNGTTNLWNAQINSLGVGTAASGTAGEIRATNNITAYYSDRRLKENITPIEDPIDKIMAISGVTFNSNDTAAKYGYTDKKRQVGVIAQEIAAVLPEIVVSAPFDIGQNPDGSEYSISGENYQTVQYEKIVPLLIEAVKAQQILINNLQTQIDTLNKDK